MNKARTGFRNIFPVEKALYRTNSYESLDLKPADREFLNIIDFYSSLKNKIRSQKEYLDVKKLFETLKMRIWEI